MSGAGEALPPGPVGQQCPAEAGGGRLGSPAHEECNEDTTEKEKDKLPVATLGVG